MVINILAANAPQLYLLHTGYRAAARRVGLGHPHGRSLWVASTGADAGPQSQSDQSEITLAHLIFQSDPSENGAKNQFVA